MKGKTKNLITFMTLEFIALYLYLFSIEILNSNMLWYETYGILIFITIPSIILLMFMIVIIYHEYFLDESEKTWDIKLFKKENEM